ncbi:ABC transporter ATP-binding protein [Streptomyces durbertensis]|uniref:ABC transporter ATP-binding protein n=1 Tax=Streptomyces durbertensis TaxID=2448886 RepID=A0ABR6EIM5_9ACTN|nr:ABC transporter ATP-binding protein [Streptomyces durbertensis]MBB1245194.1 ABC transporter ATP-binding protein [Streptomyces durbertensis]
MDGVGTPGSQNSWAVELRSVSRTYGRGAGEVAALRDLSLTFGRGSFTAVMGPSGAGKSTLLHCAAGLDRPDGGSVQLAGTDLTTLDEAQLTMLRRERIGFVFQAYNLLGSLTVEENIKLPLLLAEQVVETAWLEHVARRVGLADRMGHRPAQLSGGQQQRVAIARALVTRPEVIFADEPTGALDSRTGRGVLALLREVVDHDGNTVIMVTHDPIAASYAQRVVFLVDGAFAEVMESPTAERVAARMTRLEGL